MNEKKSDSYHHGDLRQALLEASIDMIANEGLESLTLRALSRRIGVSRTAPYRHFADKSALLAAVAEEGFKLLYEALESAGDDTDALRHLKATGIAYVNFAIDNPTHYRLMFDGGSVDISAFPELVSAAQTVFDYLLAMIERGQDKGVIKAGESRPYAYVVWSGVHGLSSLLIDNQVMPPMDMEVLINLTTQAIIDGIKT